MIISKTPLRISFCGGGTDLPAFYENAEYGAVVSTAIDKFVYLAVHRFFEKKFVLKYSSTETCESIDEIRHPLIRECLRWAETQDFLEITSFADIPASGSGLGSSSAFSVGLVHALLGIRHRIPSSETCARAACEIEIGRLGEPIGKQDQYAAAYGGWNYFRFNQDGTVHREPLILRPETRAALGQNLALYYTGLTRSASDILANQKANTLNDTDRFQTLVAMRDQAAVLRRELSEGNADALGHLLDEAWNMKRTLATGISNSSLDDIYHRAKNAGAIGGKLLGAGGGGFYLFYRPQSVDADLDAAMCRDLGLRRVPFAFERQGTRIIFVED